MQPLSAPDQAIADAVVRAVEDAKPILIDYLDVGGTSTVREVEPHHVVLGPNGSYVTGWCRLRQDERVFRMDRIHSVQPLPGTFEQPVPRGRRRGLRDAHACVGVTKSPIETPTQGCRQARAAWMT